MFPAEPRLVFTKSDLHPMFVLGAAPPNGSIFAVPVDFALLIPAALVAVGSKVWLLTTYPDDGPCKMMHDCVLIPSVLEGAA